MGFSGCRSSTAASSLHGSGAKTTTRGARMRGQFGSFCGNLGGYAKPMKTSFAPLFASSRPPLLRTPNTPANAPLGWTGWEEYRPITASRPSRTGLHLVWTLLAAMKATLL